MSKTTHLFGWKHEPVSERRTAVAPKVGGRTGAFLTTSTSAGGARGGAEDAGRLRRDAPNPRDLSLSPLALAWREAMPGGIAPDALCTTYPRVANRLALCWKDAQLTANLLDEFLGDSRGGRRGFPTLVRRELVIMRRALGPAAAR